MDAYRRPRGSPGKCFSQLRCRQDAVDPPADRFTGPYERRGPRRDRSRSPQAIDRYQPSDRNDRYRDREPLERRRRSSPRFVCFKVMFLLEKIKPFGLVNIFLL